MLEAGERLGPYEIVARLGAGGMGEVYRARDPRLKREVALKVLPAALANGAVALARFEREAQLLAALNHPHIAAIYGFEQGALAMELVEGATLAGPMAVEEGLPLAHQICEALEYAHERGIIHRDLKPGNIKVTPEGQIKLLDFGLAKALQMEASGADISNSPTLTHMATLPGVILGTAAYMAPEQAKGKPVDRRADIWAFGCVLFEMLTGMQAFRGESVTEVLAAVLSQEPDWTRLPAATPAGVRALLTRCLKKDPRQRLQAIGDARLALEEAEAAPAPASAVAVAQKAERPWGWMAACVALAVIAAGVYWTRPQAPEAASLRFTVGLPAGVSTGYGLALSPDGTRLVFAASENGKASLWLRRLGDLPVAPLPGTAGGQFPFWSPDGESLGFFAGGELKRFDFSTDSVRTLCSVTSGGARGGSWSPNGTIVFAPAVTGGLMRVSAGGGTPTPATLLDAQRKEVGQRWPFFLPDGRHFLFTAETRTGKGSSVAAVGSLASSASQILFPLPAYDSGLIYSQGYLLYSAGHALVAQKFDAAHVRTQGSAAVVAPGVVPVGIVGPTGYLAVSATPGGLLAFRRGDQSLSQLEEVDGSGKLLRTIGPPGPYANPRLSPDGRRIVLAEPAPLPGTNDLWLLDASSGARSRFTFGKFDNNSPIWSADGRWIYYGSNAVGSYAIYRKLADGSQPPQLVFFRHGGFDSPDSAGRELVFDQTVEATGTDIWWLPLGAEPQAAIGKPTPYLRTPAREDMGALSPGGRWMAYQSDSNGNGDWEIFVADFPHHASQWQVSSGGGYWPEWSSDGRALYFVSGSHLMAVSVTLGASPQFSTPRALFALHPPESLTESHPSYSPLPGGKGFLINQLVPGGQQAPMTVVTHWPQALGHQQ